MPYARSLSVQSKLIAAFVALTLAAIGVMSWIGYASARDSLRAASERELTGLQRSKSALVQNILKSARNEALSLSASEAVTNAARELLPAYRQLGQEPVPAEMQAEVRRFYREEFRPALISTRRLSRPKAACCRPRRRAGTCTITTSRQDRSRTARDEPIGRPPTRAPTGRRRPGRLGLQGVVNLLDQGNLTLVDPETLDVFFSLEQTSVLGTNLITGPYAASKMAKLVISLRNSQNVDDYRVADFEAYYPSLGDPKAFVATPVFDGPRMIAIMVLKLPIEPISNALSGNRQWQAEGLGKTGEVYLVGPDHTMRNDSRFLIEDRAAFLATLRRSSLTSRTVETIDKLGTTILVVPVEDDAARAALRGEIGPDGHQRLPWHSGVDGLRAGRPGLVAVGRHREDRRGRGDGAAR